MAGLIGLLSRFMAIASPGILPGRNLPRLTRDTAFGLAITASALCIPIFLGGDFSPR
jgi:hypothetical protein